MKLPTIGAPTTGKAQPSPPHSNAGENGKRSDFAALLEDAKPVDTASAGTGERTAASPVSGAGAAKAKPTMRPHLDTIIATRIPDPASGFGKSPASNPVDAAGGYVVTGSPVVPAPLRGKSPTDVGALVDPQADERTPASAADTSSTCDLMAILLASMGQAGIPARDGPPAGSGAPPTVATSPTLAEMATGVAADADAPVPARSAAATASDASVEPPLPAVRIAEVTIVTHQGFSRGLAGRPAAETSLAREPQPDDGATEVVPETSPLSAAERSDDVDVRAPAMESADHGDASIASFPRAPGSDALSANEFQQVLPPAFAIRGEPTLSRSVDAIAALASAAGIPADAGASSHVAPARSMVLQLAPDGLGTLSIRLHSTGGALDVRLEASDAETTSLLEDHRDDLATALGDKAYRLQSLHIGTLDAQPQGSVHGTRTADPGPASSHEPPGGNAADTHGRRERERKDPRQTPARRGNEDATMVRGDPALFV